MANLKKTKTLFGFTSPRTLEKIVPEIKLLTEKYKGKVWNVQVQVDFFKELFNSEFYEGGKMPGNVSLAARDRITRAPKSLGFVDLKPVIQLTEAGAALLTEKRLHETFTRQLLKFQLPSPYHKLTAEQFFVKPYLEFLRLAVTVEGLSKSEVALFFLQLTHIDKFNLVVQKINTFRANAKNFKGSRKSYVHGCFEKEIQQIYQAEIEKNDFKTRESKESSLKKFLKTKRSNMIDYADAFIRYMRATQLITFEPKTYRIVIPSTKADDVNYILTSIPREPALFKNETAFKS
ncbi:MAG: AlwI family type II restriction endonuclease, partial [Rhodocyclales bacterium CG_4_9_14_3_um_filter_68_10]